MLIIAMTNIVYSVALPPLSPTLLGPVSRP